AVRDTIAGPRGDIGAADAQPHSDVMPSGTLDAGGRVGEEIPRPHLFEGAREQLAQPPIRGRHPRPSTRRVGQVVEKGIGLTRMHSSATSPRSTTWIGLPLDETSNLRLSSVVIPCDTRYVARDVAGTASARSHRSGDPADGVRRTALRPRDHSTP